MYCTLAGLCFVLYIVITPEVPPKNKCRQSGTDTQQVIWNDVKHLSAKNAFINTFLFIKRTCKDLKYYLWYQ